MPFASHHKSLFLNPSGLWIASKTRGWINRSQINIKNMGLAAIFQPRELSRNSRERFNLKTGSKQIELKENALEEKDFICENCLLKRYPTYLNIALLSLFIFSLVYAYDWYLDFTNTEKAKQPFLEISNREFSIFLWQFPSFSRKNSSIKTGYLPDFEAYEERLIPHLAEKMVTVPPDLIFLYHTWKRLVGSNYIPRAISPILFEEFLNQSEEWMPHLWKAAPPLYIDLIQSQAYKSISNMQILSEEELPLIVRQAFQGWKNYFKEGKEINAFQPTFGEIQDFLEQYPHYARNHWRNLSIIAKQKVIDEEYLVHMQDGKGKKSDLFPKSLFSNSSGLWIVLKPRGWINRSQVNIKNMDLATIFHPRELSRDSRDRFNLKTGSKAQIASFLKVALFNFHQSQFEMNYE